MAEFPPAHSGDSHGAQLLRRLRLVRRRRLLIELAATLIAAAALGVVLGAFVVLMEAVWYLPSIWRFALLGLLLVVMGALPARYLWRLLRRGLSLHDVALDIEGRAPQLRQRLITALQLGAPSPEQSGEPAGSPAVRRGHSVQLLAAVTAEAAEVLQSLPSARLAPTSALRQGSLRLGVAVALVTIAGIAGGQTAMDSLHRVLHPGQSFQRPQQTLVSIWPSPVVVIRGDDVSIQVRFDGEIPATMRLQRVQAETVSTEEVILPRGLASGDSVRYEFKAVQHPFSFRVAAGDTRTDPVQVEVLDPPAVSRLQLAFEYPQHSGLPARIEEEGGDIRALAGTRVGFDIAASKALASAHLVISDTLRLPAQVTDDRAEVSWTLTAADAGQQYHIELTDVQGVGNRNPIRYAVQVLQDEDPTVAIPVPGQDGDLPENQQVTVEIEAADDFGISLVELVFTINDGPEEHRRLVRDGGARLRLREIWDLSARDLLPEDRITYWAQVFDNDVIGGPKSAQSARFVLRFPSLYELFSEASGKQSEKLDALEELATQEAEARETIEQIQRDVLRTEELTWEQRQQLETTMAAEEARARQVQELASEMAETMAKMEQDGLSSSEVLQKMDEIRELMAAVTSPEMLEALQSLQQAMEDPDPERLAEALEQFAEDQQAFQERLDRTLALLRQVQAEQRLLAAVAQSEDLVERQQTINRALEPDSGPDTNSDASDPSKAAERLGQQEASLARDTDRLQAELAELSEDFSPISQQTASALEAEAAQMERQNLAGRMRSMEQTLTSAPTDARREGAALEQDLARLNQALQSMQSSFDGAQREQLGQQLRTAMFGLVGLSMHQERLAGELAGVSGLDAAARAAEQQALARGVELVVEQIGQVGQQTMALDPGLAATIGYALTRMEGAARHLGQRDSRRASVEGDLAASYLNEAVVQLRASMDNLSQAATASAFGEAIEKMMGLSQQQMALNQATQQAQQDGTQPGAQGSGSNGLDGLPRLAAQQQRIYQALGELERSLRGQRSMESRVEAIRKDMENVLARMQRNAADPMVRQGQEHILQRMLDASRSIRNRGFEKRRKSEAADPQRYEGPNWLPVDLGQQPDALTEAMQRALAGNYPAEYRQLIRQYYETMYEDLHGPATGSLP